MQIKPTQSVIVYGDVHHISNELEQLSKHYLVERVPAQSREDAIKTFKILATRNPWHALILIAGHDIAPYDSALMGPLMPSLRLVAGTGAGFDHVDIDYLSKHNVYYANTPLAVSDPTATTSVMLTLQCVRAASMAEAIVRRGQWRLGLELTPDVRDLVVGIVGLGTIGKLVRDKLQALGFKTIYHNRKRLSRSEEGPACKWVPFEELIRTADVISLHTPLTAATRHLLSDNEFSQMKDGVFIVNTARGAVVDEKALVRALKSHKVSRVGLDVFEREPYIEPYLLECERATLLPHWATATTRVVRDVEREALANLVQWLQTGVPNTPTNKPMFGQAALR